MKYESDLSDKDWSIIELIFTKAKKGKHLQKHFKRKLVNAVRYLTKQAANGACCLKNIQTAKPYTLFTDEPKKAAYGKK
ncbi:MAG: hypothetical protein LBH62_01400 [Nitrososphaerota archaeon]|nr:hypothetical protein [Nitrososphaerota archaeon]